jgi:tRNA (cmo5U34)-methyltransferase
MKKKVDKKILSANANWSFKGKLFQDFDKHINKSVPLYTECNKLFLYLSDFFLMNNSRIVDLGCSTGNFLNSLYYRHKNNNKNLIFQGYDEVEEMIKFCKFKSKSVSISKSSINFFKKDILKIDLKNTCIVSSFYTIQFISTSKRQQIINNIYKGLNWGGAFFFVEKVRGPDARFQDIMNQFYIDFKIDAGFDSNEIINKSRSLKGVLEPFSSKGNTDMLKRAGFQDVLTVFKYGCFEGILAIK